MATLNGSYQYIGRSNGVQAYGESYQFYILLYAKTSGSESTGKHTVSVKMRLACTANSSFYGFATTAYVKVDGVNAISWSGQKIPGSAWGTNTLTEGGVTYKRYVDLKEGSVEIDTKYLSKAVTISASWIRDSINETVPSWLPKNTYATASISATLPLIPSASTITSVSNVTLGNNCSVKWTPKSASFRYKLAFACGNWSAVTGVIHPNTTAAYTYTEYKIPVEVAAQITSGTTGTMYVALRTYSDANATSLVGSEDVESFTITVPDNSSTKPTVSMTLSPVSSLPSAFDGLYIQGVTRVKADLSATGKNGADITAYSMMVDDVKYWWRDEYTSGYFATYGRKTVYGYATDDRGFTGETSQDIDVIAYNDPKIENVSVVRCDQDGNAAEDGKYLKISAKRSYSPVKSGSVQKNFCAIMYRYRSNGSYSSWVTILPRDSLGSDEITTDPLLGTLSEQESYTVQVIAIDDIGKKSTADIIVPTSKVYWHRDGERNALGLGKYNEQDNALDSAWDFFMNGHKVTGLPFPVEDTEAVTLGFLKNWIPMSYFTGDANAVTYTAMYRLQDGATNAPVDNGFLLAFAPLPGSVVFQISCDYAGSYLKYRTYWYGTWYDWKTFS